jgi:IstB-like ATP binding protein
VDQAEIFEGLTARQCQGAERRLTTRSFAPALGLAACEQGRRTRYLTTAQLVNELVEAADERQLSRLVGRYGRLDLLLLDELGYLQIDPRGAELLFQIITEREDRASIGIGTNLPFSEWDRCSPTLASSLPSSTASPSTPTSSKPAPSPTDCAPARPAAAATGQAHQRIDHYFVGPRRMRSCASSK